MIVVIRNFFEGNVIMSAEQDQLSHWVKTAREYCQNGGSIDRIGREAVRAAGFISAPSNDLTESRIRLDTILYALNSTTEEAKRAHVPHPEELAEKAALRGNSS